MFSLHGGQIEKSQTLMFVFPPDCKGDDAQDAVNDKSLSPVMDRNPSPPPDTASEDVDEDEDAIGDTVYSKHWLFSTLTRLIQVNRLL